MVLDQRKTEDITVGAVRRCFDALNRISPVVGSLDKEVAFDGYLEVYKGADRKKENRAGTIPTQVKGTCNGKVKDGTLKFPVEIADLKIYYAEGGVLFFCVDVNEDTKHGEVYYKSLLPYDLNEILGQASEGQQKKTLSFTMLPDDARQIERICLDFLRDSTLQKTLSGINCTSSDELIRRGIPIREYGFTQTLYKDEAPLSFGTFSNGAYIYGRAPWGESYVVDKISPPSSIAILTQHELSAGDFTFNMKVRAEQDASGITEVQFGCVQICFGKTARLTYKDGGALTQRYQSAALMKGLLETEELFLDGTRLAAGLRVDSDIAIKIDELFNQYDKCRQLREVLALKIDWDLTDLPEADVINLNILIHVFVHGCKLHPKKELSQHFCATIGDSCIVLLTKGSVEDGYELYDLLNPDLCFVFGITEHEEVEDGEFHPVPALFALSVDNLIKCANIDAGRFAISLDKYPIMEETSEQACLKLLDMIRAYDKKALCADEIYECCADLANRLVELKPASDNALINRMQVKKRREQLSTEDRSALLNFLAESQETMLRASAAILLDNSDVAHAIIDSLDDDMRQAFLAWPIADLL